MEYSGFRDPKEPGTYLVAPHLPERHPRLLLVRAPFFAALFSPARPLVDAAFRADACRLGAPRFFAAVFVCFESARCDAVVLGSRFSACSLACDR